MQAREVHSVAEAVEAYAEAVGAAKTSNMPIARLTERKTNHVSNWKAEGKFPADTFLILSAAFREKQIIASPSLWGIREPAEAAE